MLYVPSTDQISIYKSTFGAMAYTTVILGSLVCIYGASGEGSYDTLLIVAAAVLTASCAVVALKGEVHFVTHEDEFFFWISVIYIVCYCVACNHRVSVCTYTLSAVVAAIYRTPETPYVAWLCIVFTIRVWKGMLSKNLSWWGQIERIGEMMYLCLLTQIGLLPQFTVPEVWPFYAAVGLCATFTWVQMRY